MIKIPITKEDRQLGKRTDEFLCPVSRAIRRVIGENVLVGSMAIYFSKPKHFSKMELSFWQSLAILIYDKTGIMLLKSIKIPEAWMPKGEIVISKNVLPRRVYV